MDWTTLITELGGGLPAVVIAALAFWIWNREKRINELTDKFIEQNGENINAMHSLADAVRGDRNV
jgi:hypothetical protein